VRSRFAACIGALFLICGASAAQAKLNVFACVPEWAALTTAIGGDRVDVNLAINALTDPEKTGATPGMILAMQQADLFVCTGADLETEWLPAVLDRANNPKVAVGKPGQFYASQFVPIQTDKSPIVDTLHKHLHTEGNPHIQGDPRNVIRVGAQLTKRLIALDPEGAPLYAANYKAFVAKMKDVIAALEKKAAPLRNQRVVVQHENSLYLLNWLGIGVAATV
jgi:zinc/manganese transport system substrate-binding protein